MGDYVGVRTGTDAYIGAREVEESDGVVKYHQTCVFAAGVVEFNSTPDIDSVTAAATSSEIDCKGKGNIVVKVSFSESSGDCEVRLELMNDTTSIGVSVEEYIDASLVQDTDGRYLGEPYVLTNDVGATKFKIHLISAPSSGNVSLWGGAW